jgi:uncharacterized protein (DUF983 family)
VTADNWALCPRCEKKRLDAAEAAVKVAQAKCDDAYGKVTSADFLLLHGALTTAQNALQALTDTPDRQEFHTLREDYEVGVWDSELFVSYKGNCKDCGLKVEFKHTEAVA